MPLGRYGSVFTQIIPLLAIKVGCSLSFILKAYSFSIAFFFYVVYLGVTFLLRNNKITIVYLLTICAACRSTFYFSIAEIYQGIALCVLLYGLVKQLLKEESSRKLLKTIIAILIIAALYYFHQLLIFAILFCLFTAMIHNKSYRNKYLIGLIGFSIVWFGGKILLLPSNSYAGNKIPELAIFIEQLPNIFNLHSFNNLMVFARNELWLPLITVLIALFMILIRKRGLLVLFFVTYITGYLVLIIITYYNGEASHMYELYYIVFGFFIGVILDTAWERELTTKSILFLVLPILVFSMNRLYLAHETPSKRVFYMEQLSKNGKKIKNKKYIIDPKYIHELGVTWAFPMEMILASSIESNENSITCFVPENFENVELILDEGRLYAPSWLRYKVNTKLLDTNYFTIPLETKYLKLNKK